MCISPCSFYFFVKMEIIFTQNVRFFFYFALLFCSLLVFTKPRLLCEISFFRFFLFSVSHIHQKQKKVAAKCSDMLNSWQIVNIFIVQRGWDSISFQRERPEREGYVIEKEGWKTNKLTRGACMFFFLSF